MEGESKADTAVAEAPVEAVPAGGSAPTDDAPAPDAKNSEELLRAELAQLFAKQADGQAAEERLMEKLQATIELEISMAVRVDLE
jgi:hypothetical protein